MKYKTEDIIDIKKVSRLLDSYTKATGLVSALMDLDGNILSQSGWQSICTKFHRINSDTAEHCHKSDTILAGKLQDGNKYNIYKCLNGLVDVAVPIIVNDVHLYNLFTGQFLTEEPNEEFFVEQADKYKFDKKKYMLALSEVPVLKESDIKNKLLFLSQMTEMIVELGLAKYEYTKTNIALIDSEHKFRALYDNAPLSYQSLNEDGSFKDVNPTWLSLLGYERDEIIGNFYKDFLHPDWQANFDINFPKFKKNGYASDVQYKIRHKTGRYLDISFEGCIGYNADGSFKQTYCVFQDITKRKTAEKTLKNTFDLSPSIISKVNIIDGYFIEVNQAVHKILGYTIEEFKSIPFMELIHPDDRHLAVNEISEQINGKAVTFFENRYLCKDGSYKWTAWHGTPADDNGIVTAIGTDIHERKHIEQALVKSEKKYRDLVNLAQEGVWVIDKHNITSFTNPSMAKILGYAIEEMIGKSLFYFTDEHGANIAECNLERRKSGIKDTHDFEFIHKDGHTIIASLATAPMIDKDGNYDGIIAGVMDVTKRRHSKAKLQESETTYRSLFEKAPLGTAYHQMIYDESGKPINYRILEANLRYQALTGLTESPVGKLITDVFPGIENDPFNWINTFGNVAKTGKEINFQQKLEFNNRWYSLVAYQNKPDHFVATFFEITEQKIGEIELVAAKEKAEESDRLKSAFLTNMSHEIRTPLNAVIGFSEILYRNHLTDEEKATFTKYIRLNGESLVKIIDDIIDISALQSNQITIDNYDFNLPALFDELDNYYNSVLVQKSKTNIKLVLKLPEAVKYSFFIKSDEPRLKQILNNLISNAIKYTETGQITFGCKLEESNLYFYVKDTGYGIAPENMESIFERFKQYSSQYVSKHEGTGLGLSICKQLVILLGGELSVKSKVGNGSTFYFSIPLVKAAYPMQNKEPVIVSENKSLLNYKILIADDEELNYEMLKRMLKPSKVSTDWAKNGKHALELAVTTKYDLILMDIKMPEMDGIEATRLIKKHNKKIPIIIQTAFAMKEIKDEAIEAGCDGFIAKPIGLDVFMQLVHKHIGV